MTKIRVALREECNPFLLYIQLFRQKNKEYLAIS